MTTQNFTIQWQGINIDVSYNDNYSRACRKIYGYGMAHLEIQSEGKKGQNLRESESLNYFLSELKPLITIFLG